MYHYLRVYVTAVHSRVHPVHSKSMTIQTVAVEISIAQKKAPLPGPPHPGVPPAPPPPPPLPCGPEWAQVVS